jgi:hypothetical protein
MKDSPGTRLTKEPSMKPTALVAVLCVTAIPVAAALQISSPSILEPKTERLQGPPLWISAEAVADAEKLLDLDRIGSPLLRTNVEKQRRALGPLVEKSPKGEKPAIVAIPSSECTSRIGSSDHRGGDEPRASLSDLATYSRSIVRGKIRTVEPGFSFGEPSSLLGVEISDVLKGGTPEPVLYVDYPVAQFKIGPFTFCNLNQGFEPKPDDEVLLFDYTGPIDRKGILYAPSLEQIFFQRQGSLFLSPRLKNSPDLKTVHSLDEVARQLHGGSSRGGSQ